MGTPLPEIDLIEVETPSQITLVAELAKAIWTEHFVPIIGQAQVDYMLRKFQSEAAVASQLGENYRYFVIARDGVPLGYAAVVHIRGSDEMQLSKFYIRREYRKKGAGREALRQIEARAAAQSVKSIWLTVNRNNQIAINAYEKLGFVKEGELVQDIGNGFMMDDYKMRKRLR